MQVMFMSHKNQEYLQLFKTNSCAGVTNKILGKRVRVVLHDGMERFFNPQAIVFTGNPVRPAIQNITCGLQESLDFFGLNAQSKIILVVGGSLGARTVNQSVAASVEKIAKAGVQVIWQTGKQYYEEAKHIAQAYPTIKVYDFIRQMDYAYTTADIIISRAGAGTISELCIVGKPCVFSHLPMLPKIIKLKMLKHFCKQAALLIPDADAKDTLFDVTRFVTTTRTYAAIITNIKALAIPNAAEKL